MFSTNQKYTSQDKDKTPKFKIRGRQTRNWQEIQKKKQELRLRQKKVGDKGRDIHKERDNDQDNTQDKTNTKRDKEKRTKMDLLLMLSSNGAALRLVRPEDNARQDESKTRQEKRRSQGKESGDKTRQKIQKQAITSSPPEKERQGRLAGRDRQRRDKVKPKDKDGKRDKEDDEKTRQDRTKMTRQNKIITWQEGQDQDQDQYKDQDQDQYKTRYDHHQDEKSQEDEKSQGLNDCLFFIQSDDTI